MMLSRFPTKLRSILPSKYQNYIYYQPTLLCKNLLLKKSMHIFFGTRSVVSFRKKVSFAFTSPLSGPHFIYMKLYPNMF